MGAQKNRLIETVLLSTHNICFGREIRKLFFCYILLTKGLSTLPHNQKFRLKLTIKLGCTVWCSTMYEKAAFLSWN